MCVDLHNSQVLEVKVQVSACLCVPVHVVSFLVVLRKSVFGKHLSASEYALIRVFFLISHLTRVLMKISSVIKHDQGFIS